MSIQLGFMVKHYLEGFDRNLDFDEPYFKC